MLPKSATVSSARLSSDGPPGPFGKAATRDQTPRTSHAPLTSYSRWLLRYRRNMSPEDIKDAVLSIVSAADEPLTAEEICDRIRPPPELRDVRIALRDLSSDNEVLKDSSQRWKVTAKAPLVTDAPAHDFTDDELRRARQRHGTISSCPNCRKRGDIDRLFSWRRMHPDDRDLVPQSWCIACRALSSRK